MRRLTASQVRVLRFLAGTGGSWHVSVANITWDRLHRGRFVEGPISRPRITPKGHEALSKQEAGDV